MIILLLWRYELVMNKMSYYWFNRQELLKKVKEKYHNCGGKEKAAEYYFANKEVKTKASTKRRTKRNKKRI